MKRVSINLSDLSSIQEAIKQVEEYRNMVGKKTEEAKDAVTQELFQNVETGFGFANYDDIVGQGFKDAEVPVSIEKGQKTNKVVASGKDAVFMEFGAGVHYNPGGGSYPGNRPSWIENIGSYGLGYGKRDKWRYYDKSTGEWVQTYGTPSSAVMFNSTLRVKNQLADIVKRVFSE